MPKPENNERESEIAELRKRIYESFPDEKVDGMEFPGDGEALDDAREIYYTI